MVEAAVADRVKKFVMPEIDWEATNPEVDELIAVVEALTAEANAKYELSRALALELADLKKAKNCAARRKK